MPRFDLKFGADSSIKNKRQSSEDLRVSSILGKVLFLELIKLKAVGKT